MGEDANTAYLEMLRRAFRIAGRTGERCRPVHLLLALTTEEGAIGEALAPLRHDMPGEVVSGAPDRGGSAGYLVMQTQEAARGLAADRREAPAAGHLLLAVIDQEEPEAMTSLAGAGIDVTALRQVALRILGAPADLPRIRVPDLVPAGTMDRPPLPVGELDPRAWGALEWRQQHLPLRRLRRRAHYGALCHLERRAAWRVASRLDLDDDQGYSLCRHHLDRVDQLVARVRPDLVPRPRSAGGTAVRVSAHLVVTHPPAMRRPHRKWTGFPSAWRTWLSNRRVFPTGWGTWVSNRRVGLRDRWFRIRSAGSYRGAPPI